MAIGDERIRVRFGDGRVEELRLHDYERLYALPGLYEQIVQVQLGCRSPAVMAEMLAAAVDGCGWARADARVIDVAAGNGVSGEALAAAGLHPVLGTDIVAAARAAAVRDRPGVYDDYLTLDLLALSEAQRSAIAGLRANVLCCVAPVGPSGVPAPALAVVAQLLVPGALVGYLHEPGRGLADEVTADLLGPGATELVRERYVHRRLLDGRPFEMDGVVWRLADQAQ